MGVLIRNCATRRRCAQPNDLDPRHASRGRAADSSQPVPGHAGGQAKTDRQSATKRLQPGGDSDGRGQFGIEHRRAPPTGELGRGAGKHACLAAAGGRRESIASDDRRRRWIRQYEHVQYGSPAPQGTGQPLGHSSGYHANLEIDPLDGAGYASVRSDSAPSGRVTPVPGQLAPGQYGVVQAGGAIPSGMPRGMGAKTPVVAVGAPMSAASPSQGAAGTVLGGQPHRRGPARPVGAVHLDRRI